MEDSIKVLKSRQSVDLYSEQWTLVLLIKALTRNIADADNTRHTKHPSSEEYLPGTLIQSLLSYEMQYRMLTLC